MIVYNSIDYTYVQHHYQHYLNASQLAPTTVYDLQHYYSIAMMTTMSRDDASRAPGMFYSFFILLSFICKWNE